MSYLAGILIAVFALVAAIFHLHQDSAYFWDFVAFSCVSGGTLAVALITFPWQYRRAIARAALGLIYSRPAKDREAIQTCFEYLRQARSGGHTWEKAPRNLCEEVLRDGGELLNLGFSKEKVHEILEERIFQSFERAQKIANSFRSLAKYPPAFGLAGTVLGLVSLMRKVSDGADAKQTGLMMAIALMATFYGLLTANLFVSPAGESLAKSALAERKAAEIALHTILLLAENASLLEAQEVLNSYVIKRDRVSAIGNLVSEAS